MGALGRGKGKRLSGADRKLQIISVATQLISKRGYWGVSLQDIAAQCEITDSAVLHHFGNKENVLLAVMEYRDEADRLALAEHFHVAREDLYPTLATKTLTQVCRAMMERNESQPEIVRLYSVLSAESLQSHHPMHEYFYEREQKAISTFVSTQFETTEDRKSVARRALALMDGIQLRWLRDSENVPLLAEWDAAAQELVGGANR